MGVVAAVVNLNYWVSLLLYRKRLYTLTTPQRQECASWGVGIGLDFLGVLSKRNIFLSEQTVPKGTGTRVRMNKQ